MSSSNYITTYLSAGLAADIPAAPTPGTPSTGTVSLYYETDTGIMKAWDGSAYQSVNPIATDSVAGLVIPDGTIITVASNGDITVPEATASVLGVVKVDNSTIQATTGVISLKNTAVTAGSYTLADITVDAQGRITAASDGSASGGITALSGDVTASGSGSVAATLATVNSDVGSFTSANITVNAKGLVTAAANGSGGGGAGLWGGLITAPVAGTTFPNALNGASSSQTTLTNGVEFFMPNTSGANSFQGFYKSAPSTPYQAVFLISPKVYSGNSDNGYVFGWYDGSNEIFGAYLFTVSGAFPTPLQPARVQWATPTSGFSSSNINDGGANEVFTVPFLWVRLGDTGANLTIEFSIDGGLWTMMFNEPYGTSMNLTASPPDICIGADCYNSNSVFNLLSYSD